MNCPMGSSHCRCSAESPELDNHFTHSVAFQLAAKDTEYTHRVKFEQFTNVPLANDSTAQTVEANMQTNKGNSGGPVINDRGELVAVVEGHSIDARSVSLYIDVTEVRRFLDDTIELVAPATTALLTKRAENHYKSMRFDAALSDFTQVLKLNPTDSYAMSSRGWIFLDRGDHETALTEFDGESKPIQRCSMPIEDERKCFQV